MTSQTPIKVTKLPKYKKELMKKIVRRCELMLKDVFPHLTKRDYEIATYSYKIPGELQIYFNEKFVVDLVLKGDFPRIKSINNVLYPADKPNITYDKTIYITSNFYKLTRNVHTGVSVIGDIIIFNLATGGLRIVSSDGTRYMQQ
jgi:hypothetical protein